MHLLKALQHLLSRKKICSGDFTLSGRKAPGTVLAFGKKEVLLKTFSVEAGD
jgi:hypothetical protein